MRCSGIGTRRPPSWRSSASARVAFQRQRLVKTGETRTAWIRSSTTLSRRTMPHTLSGAQVGDGGRQLARPRRRLAEPEGDRRRRTAGVLDVDAPGPDAPDAPGVVPEKEDVARHALDGEVLVDGADLQSLRLLDDLVVGRVG